MDNFDERLEYEEFDEMEERMEENRLEMRERYDDMIYEPEMNGFVELVFDSRFAEDHPEAFVKESMEEGNKESPENISLEFKADSLEPIESVQEPVPENNTETRGVSEHLDEISEKIEHVPDKGAKQKYPEWEEKDEIPEEELPTSPLLKPINKEGELYREIGIRTDEEKEAYWDYIREVMNKEHKVLMDIPVPENTEPWPPIETEESISFPFSSMDYLREHPFDKYHWKLEKVYEKVKDLGIYHSSVSNEEGKDHTRQRYEKLVANEFKDQADFILDTYKKYPQWMDKQKVFERLADLNSKIEKW